MSRNITDLIEFTVLFSIISFRQYLSYRFPHFNMHLKYNMTAKDFDFLKVCNELSKEDIDRYKMRQKYILIGTSFVESLILGYLVISI